MDVFDDFCTAQSEQPTPMTFATAVHLIRGRVSLLLAVLLIALKQNPAGVRRYRDARRCIIGTAMVNVVVDCLSAAADFSGNRISHLIDGTIVPLAYIAQAILLGVAVSIMLKDGKTANTRHFAVFYAAFLALSAACVLTPEEGAWQVLLLLRTATLAGCTITFLNRHNTLTAQDTQVQASADTIPQIQNSGVLSAMQSWARRADKPYLKESLTISEVSSQIGISMTQISFALNHSLGINFNTWINRLRINEAKHQIEADPDIQISDVAFKSGFSDIAVFSRNFKKLEGVTATEFKRQKAMEARQKHF